MESKQSEIDVYSDLITNFTHQIINPLNGVVGTVDNLIDGTIPARKREQRLKAVRAQLSHSIELVRNLAYLSQLSTEAGRESVSQLKRKVVLPKVVIESAQFFQDLAGEKNIRIELTDRRTQYLVFGDTDLLRQVFTNLFENATKYGDENSVVHVETRVRSKGQKQELIVEVVNQGGGFDYDERDIIFVRGKRGKQALNKKASGSGIGLYLCREILQVAFGATIEAEHSTKLRETTFRIRFPRFAVGEDQHDGF